MDAALPNEINALRELVSTLQGTLTEAKSLTETLQVENRLLRQKLEHFIKRYFGASRNEGLDIKQMELLLAGLQSLSTPAPVPQSKAAGRATVAALNSLPRAKTSELKSLTPSAWRKSGDTPTTPPS